MKTDDFRKVCVSGACKSDPRLQPATTPKPFEITSHGRVIILIKSAHIAPSDPCGRGQAVCDVRVQFQMGSRKWNTKLMKSTRLEWNEEINVDFDVKFNDSIHFSIWSGSQRSWVAGKRIGNFSVDLRDIIEYGKSGKPLTYGFGKSTSFLELVITWNNKNDHGYFWR